MGLDLSWTNIVAVALPAPSLWGSLCEDESGTGEENLHFFGFWLLLHLHATLLRGVTSWRLYRSQSALLKHLGHVVSVVQWFLYFFFYSSSDNSYTLMAVLLYLIAFDFLTYL